MLKNAEIRKAFTKILPRTAILKASGRHLGAVANAPIHKIHPGYNRAAKFQSNDLYKLFEKEQIELPVTISLGIDKISRKKIGRVLSDAFVHAGINVQFRELGEENLDGYYHTWYLPWPEMNFTQSFHSTSSNLMKMFGGYTSDQLDSHLLAYSLSLTQKNPDFSKLKRVHSHLAKLEPFSILFNHSACLRVVSKYSKEFEKITSLDPDWFKVRIW